MHTLPGGFSPLARSLARCAVPGPVDVPPFFFGDIYDVRRAAIKWSAHKGEKGKYLTNHSWNSLMTRRHRRLLSLVSPSISVSSQFYQFLQVHRLLVLLAFPSEIL